MPCMHSSRHTPEATYSFYSPIDPQPIAVDIPKIILKWRHHDVLMQSGGSRRKCWIVGDRGRVRRMRTVAWLLGGCFHLLPRRGETVVCWNIAQEIEYSGVSEVRIPRSLYRFAV